MGIQKVLSRSDKAEVEDNCYYYNCHFQEAMKEQLPFRDDGNTNSCMEVGLERSGAIEELPENTSEEKSPESE